MAADIVSIEHVPEEAAVVVTLQPKGRCPNPYLRGRLSGPAIIILEWTSSESNSKLFGRYHQVPISGHYYVEIIAIVCQDFSHVMEFDFQNTCLEEPANNRLTGSNVRIYIDKTRALKTTSRSSRHSNNLQAMGYWIHQSDERAANDDYSALYTRFQPRGCLRLNDPTHEHFHMPPKHCIEPTDWNRFEPYTRFHYYNPIDGTEKTNFLQSAQDIQAPTPTTICLVGGSHSRTLKASMLQHHNFTLANNNVQIEWIKANLPKNVNNKTIVNNLAGCHKILLAVGQWPASFSGHKPTLFSAFRSDMIKLVGRLQAHLSTTPPTEIWLRSIHDNPLNERISGYCPPKDWRSPTVLSGYNRILRGVAASTNVRFVDTSFIVTPLWDASTDWGHVCPQASHVEALYLVAVVLGLVEPNT